MGDVNGRNNVDLGTGDLEEIYFPDEDGDSTVPEVSPNETDSGLHEYPDGDSRDSRDTSASRRTSWTAAELLATDFPEPRWAVPGLIAEGVTVIAGAPKVGKSWLSLGLGIATATGGKALGKLDVEPGPSLYLALEDTPRRLKTRLARMTPDLPSGLDKLTIATECPPLPVGGDAKIAAWLDRHHDARLVVIDVFSKVRGPASRDLSAYDADYAAMSRAKSVADHYGVPFVIVHHTRKMEAKDFLDEVSGTQGLAGAADAVMVLKRLRGKADGILHLTGRDVDEAEFALSFAAEFGAWQLLGVPAAEVAMGETRLAVLQYVRDHEGTRPRHIADDLGLDYELTKKTCVRMVKDGQLDTDGKGRYFVPFTGVPGVPTVPEPASSQVIALFDGDTDGDTDLSPVPDEEEDDPHRTARDTAAALEEAETARLAASQAHQEALKRSIAAEPIREYLIHRFGSYSGPPSTWTLEKMAPHHDPAEVRAALDQLVAEGVCRVEDGRYVSLIDEARERDLLAASKSASKIPRSQKWRVDGFRVVATLYKSHRGARCTACGNSGAVHSIWADREDGMSGHGEFCDAHRPAKGTLPPLDYERISHSDDANGLSGGSVVTFDRLTPNPAWECTECGQSAISRIEQRCTDCDDPAHWSEQTIPVMHYDGTEEQRTTRNHETHVIAESFRCTDHIPTGEDDPA